MICSGFYKTDSLKLCEVPIIFALMQEQIFQTNVFKHTYQLSEIISSSLYVVIYNKLEFRIKFAYAV